jgi:maltose-binding protein MalE
MTITELTAAHDAANAAADRAEAAYRAASLRLSAAEKAVRAAQFTADHLACFTFYEVVRDACDDAYYDSDAANEAADAAYFELCAAIEAAQEATA